MDIEINANRDHCGWYLSACSYHIGTNDKYDIFDLHKHVIENVYATESIGDHM